MIDKYSDKARNINRRVRTARKLGKRAYARQLEQNKAKREARKLAKREKKAAKLFARVNETQSLSPEAQACKARILADLPNPQAQAAMRILLKATS